MKKIKKSEVEKYLQDNGGWELLSDYKGSHEEIIIQKNGYLCATNFSSFKINNSPIIFGIKNKFYKNNIKLFLSRKQPQVEFVDAYLVRKNGKSRIVVDMIDEKGHNFSKTWEHIYTEDKLLCCKICARKMQTNNHREKMYEKWENLIDTERFIILEKPTYFTSESRVVVEEKSTHYRYDSSIRAFKDFNCQAFNVYANKRFFIYNLLQYAINNGYTSVPLELVDTSKSHNIVKFKCKCGNTYERSVHKWMNGRELCEKCSCSQSSYEKTVEQFLIDNNIQYIKEFRYNSCKDNKPLPFDFYLKDYNILIEVDGEQHFKPVAYDGDIEKAKKKFDLLNKHDAIKTDFCKNNNIPLLRIPYTYFLTNEWKETIYNFIKPLEK